MAKPHPVLVCIRRTIKHRSLSPNDPFGEEAFSKDPSDGFYGSWSDVDMDAFANAASSDEIRTAHFGPEWSRFTTIGRLSVKKMQNMRNVGERDLSNTDVWQKGGGTSMESLAVEELHLRELEARKKLLERNYTSYEEYVANELSSSGVDDNNNHNSNNNMCEDYDEGDSTDTLMDGESNYSVPLPRFITEEKRQIQNVGSPKPPITAGDISVPGRRDISQVPESLMCVILNALGDPHGDPQLPRKDPLHWSTDDIILWLTKMENLQLDLTSASTVGSEELRTTTDMRETSVMQDLSMQAAFRMARINGEFLLQHTLPSTMFQVMRRWYLRRQEIGLTILKQQQRSQSSQIVNTNMDDVIHSDDVALHDILVSKAIEDGRAKLDEAISRVTPLLIQETISQCYPYCR